VIWPALEEAAKSASEGSVIVAGDVNSTADMREFRQLLGNGYNDASEQAGAGMTATFPADVLLPPFLGIDHILTRECTATLVRTVTVPGSDHRAMVADIELPRTSTNSSKYTAAR
jgi:endonuclease/exonuclease/phosphatase (EEP) superfamily protein YafD